MYLLYKCSVKQQPTNLQSSFMTLLNDIRAEKNALHIQDIVKQ